MVPQILEKRSNQLETLDFRRMAWSKINTFLIDINSMPHYGVILHALDYLSFGFTINIYI